jgi:hypothetical protein
MNTLTKQKLIQGMLKLSRFSVRTADQKVRIWRIEMQLEALTK